MLSAINLSKSAFGMIKLDSRTFFTSYNCPDPTNHQDVLVRCKMQIRVSPFVPWSNCSSSWVSSKRAIPRLERTRIPALSHAKSKLSIIHELEYVDLLSVCSASMVHSPVIVLMVGVVKTHQLTYSPTQTLYAICDRSRCTQHFVIQSRIAKEYLDHFQSKIEEVDIYVDGDKLIWNGFTEGFTGDDSRTYRSHCLIN
jgi:hypothetical protein